MGAIASAVTPRAPNRVTEQTTHLAEAMAAQ